MNREEALNLCRMAKAICPAQAIDDFTPDAWALVLEDDRYDDARQALKELSREQPFVHVSEIVQRIKRIRRNRVLDFGVLPDPPRHIDPDDQRAHTRWLAEVTKQIADGAYEAPAPEAIEPARNVAELGQVRSVDSALATRPLREAHAEARRTLQEIDADKKAERDAKQARLEEMQAADREVRAQLATTQPTNEESAHA